MKEPRITFDRTEIVAKVVMNREIRTMVLPYDHITSVSYEPFYDKVLFLFGRIPSRRLVLRIKGMRDPAVFRERAEPEFFQDYLAGLRGFCKEHRITFYDKVALAAQAQEATQL